MSKIINPDYLAKVKLLNSDEIERLLSRMSGKLPRRLEKEKISQDEALAIQLELEDEQLQEWRAVMTKLKNAEEAKSAAKTKSVKAAEIVVAEKNKKPKKETKAEIADLPVPKLASLPQDESVSHKAKVTKKR